jgi:hypothetical protein
MMIKRFTAYRREISQRDTHTALHKNPDDQPQFEGVIFTDGSVALRWLTPLRSTSVWPDLHSALGVHGHPEYGTVIEWHDGDPEPDWLQQIENWKAAIAASEDK